MNSALSFFKNLSFLKTPFTLNFQGQPFISSWSGFILSMGVLSVLLLFASESDLFVHKSPQVVDSSPALDSRPLVYFRNLRAFGVSDDVTLENFLPDPSLFQINVVILNSTLNGSFINITTIDLHLCTEDDFPEDPSLYDNLGLNGFLCLYPNTEFQLQGYYDEALVQSVEVHFLLCDNSTSNNTCQSYENMASQLFNKDFNLYYFDSIIDPSNYLAPIKQTLVNEWAPIDVNLKKLREYYIENLEVQTNDGIFFDSWNILTGYQYMDQSRELITVNEALIESPRIIFAFLSAKTKRTVTRFYEKISGLFANLGGTLHFLVSILCVWSYFENYIMMKKILLNEMYSFKLKSKLKKGKEKKCPDAQLTSAIMSPNFETEQIDSSKRKGAKQSLFSQGEHKNIEIGKIEKHNETNEKVDLVGENNKCIKEDIFVRIAQKSMNEITPLPESQKNIEQNPIESSVMSKSKNEPTKGVSVEHIPRRSISPPNRKKSLHLSKKEQHILNFSQFRNKQKEKKIQINVLKFMKLKSKRLFRMKLNEEEEIFEKSDKLFCQNLDYIEIMKKIQEIEKIKNIVFDQHQLEMFDFLSKPLIYIEEESSTEAFQDKMRKTSLIIGLNRKEENEKDKIKKLINYFESKKASGNLSEIDRRLMENLDRDLADFLENSNDED